MNGVAFARPPGGLHAAAARELSSAAYRWSSSVSPAGRPWWERFTSWVGDFWQYVVEAVFGHVRTGPVPPFAGDLVLLLAVGLVVVVAVRLLMTIALERKRAAGGELLADPIPASEWYRRAVARAAQGDLADASRCILAAAVALLRERGTIEPTAGATIGDLRRELVARAPQYATPFWTIARAFAISSYAERPLDRADFDGAIRAYRTIAGDA